ncbi:competence type IV pilus ATPase ComGA [Sporolactobacillus vineae]|uniref:competence type IV pilus ATPase ComGA n=1 Tax=Sporolactobacillus vineae TaxID=444463 RepID=UPI000289F019|nr:competence type IV pilus ATPase ComGA [Sporolactobacillus vineae]
MTTPPDPIEWRSRKIIEHAAAADASDIHFIPRFKDTLIELRVHGYLQQMTVMDPSEAERIINHFKFYSGMDIGERRLPQSGSMQVQVSNESLSLRLSTLPASGRESMVIRLLPRNKTFLISDLSLFDEAVNGLERLLHYESGLIVISGPTGSGKTTTLYTLLSALEKQYHARVITLEDPIEKKHDAFVQLEINEKANFTYADGFKAILRSDPDIVMVGEIRDEETAKIAIRASLTGHLVLSTVHAFNAPGTIQRLIELGIPRFDLKETLVGVISERLVNVRCPVCGDVCAPDCEHRRHAARTGIFEILAGKPLYDILTAREKRPDYKTFDDYLEEGIASGWISAEGPKGGRTELDLQKRLD